MGMLRMLNWDRMKENKLLKKMIPKSQCSQLKPNKTQNLNPKSQMKEINDEICDV
jgi:hypothetical protein